ncbi:MAG TPA: phosphodiester glycosidase family protein [Gemmatimonadaceae bacterium]|nr:phosphodiester glycosidase family protein [Gemmatimonadaceae bacterium]
MHLPFTRPFHASLVCGLIVIAGCSPDIAEPPSIVTPAVPTDTVRTAEIAPGVRHIYRWEVAGPWAIHVVEVDLTRCGLSLRTVKAFDRLVGRETTTQLVSRLAARIDRPVYAAINGDYFSFTPPGVPVGIQVSEGEPLRGYTSRPVFGLTSASTTYFGADQLTGRLRSRRGVVFDMRRVNEPPDTLRIALYNSFVGPVTLTDTGAVEVAVRITRRAAGIGDTARAVVQGVDTSASGVAIPLDGVVLAGKGRGAAYLRANVAAGDTISWVMRFPNVETPITEMIAGDPHLLRAGNSLAPFAGTVAADRHPRTAIAVTSDRKALLITVDGRQPGYSVGMTLVELTGLLSRLGANEALNLDGGGSTTMALGTRYVNRPSDATGERPVANAVAVVGPVSGTCR